MEHRQVLLLVLVLGLVLGVVGVVLVGSRARAREEGVVGGRVPDPVPDSGGGIPGLLGLPGLPGGLTSLSLSCPCPCPPPSLSLLVSLSLSLSFGSFFFLCDLEV